MRGHPLVEQAQATLCRLADAPPAAEAAAAAIAELERACDKRPLAVGIGGDLPARTELVNYLCGGRILDPYGRVRGSAAVRIVRGTPAAFRAERADGSVEVEPFPPDRAGEVAAAHSRAEAARTELATRERALVRVEPPPPPRPPWWAIWSWILIWLARWRPPARESASEPQPDPELLATRARAEAAASEAAALETQVRLARTRYFDALQALASGAPGVIDVAITLAASPLPEGIEIVELAGTSRAGAELDALLLVKDGQLHAPGAPGAPPQPLGDFAHALAALPALATDARALRLSRRIETKITGALASLADALERKEATLRERIARFEVLQLADPDAFAHAQLAAARAEISASVTAVVEHAAAHLGSELATLHHDWISWIGDAQHADALKTGVAKIELEWGARPLRIAEEVEVLVVGGLGGCVRDIYPGIVAPLLDRGLPKDHAKLKAAPELGAMALLPSLRQEPAKLERGSWFAGLFRSFEAQRGKVRERVYERIERLRELADAELLDAEPRLAEAIRTTLAGLLATAIAHQTEHLEATLRTEYAAVTRERKLMAPLAAIADTVRDEVGRLGEMIARLERDRPAVVVMTAAAETASL